MMPQPKRAHYLAILILLFSSVSLTACPGPFLGKPEDEVTHFPVSYTGAATVSFPNDVGSKIEYCKADGTYTLLIPAEGRCLLNVSSTWFYIGTDGECTTNGDIIGWNLKGSYMTDDQICDFGSANDGVYSASGKMTFSTNTSFSTYGNSLSVTDPQDGEVQVSIQVHPGTVQK